MSIINMLRGGKAHGDNGDQYNYNMYPRPDLLLENMAEFMGWENSKDSFHMVHRWNSCLCHDKGALMRAKKADPTTDACGLEVGDEIPLVWIPNRATLEAVTLTVNAGIAGVVGELVRYSVQDGEHVIADATEEAIHLAGSDLGPLPSATIDQAAIDALGCDERLDLDKFCQACSSGGCMYQEYLPDPELVGGCEPEGQYLSLRLTELPDDFDCASCCLDIDVGARLRIARCGD